MVRIKTENVDVNCYELLTRSVLFAIFSPHNGTGHVDCSPSVIKENKHSIFTISTQTVLTKSSEA